MKRNKPKTVSCLIGIFLAITSSGCAVRHHHHGEGESNRIRNARIAAIATAGLLAIGTLAWLYSRSENDKRNRQTASEAAPQTQEPEKP